MWKTAARPYFTLGAGPYYHKSYRTGNDYARVAIASFLSTGMDTPVAPNQMLGFDIRLARVRSEISPANPVFGGGQPRATHWSAKLSYAVHY